ncbi:MAG: phosphoribosylanthranilate isomerase [Chthoniobacteraceae bacterium]|nr:phosphoribosylanthranilate isomerase [Chthoniobacteraceae bacterium]
MIIPKVRIKICGITNPGDAEAAIEAGADALGFNGFPGSKRFLDLRAASGWIAQLPPFVTRVAVLVNPAEQEVRAVAALPGIDRLQFHGHETPEFCAPFAGGGFVKALAAKDREALELASRYATRSILLDAFVPGAFGGTGKVIDWALAAAFVREHPFLRVILSGGLTPENAAEAVRAVRPYAVDVASGVESHPCKKDPSRMRDFIAAVRESGV